MACEKIKVNVSHKTGEDEIKCTLDGGKEYEVGKDLPAPIPLFLMSLTSCVGSVLKGVIANHPRLDGLRGKIDAFSVDFEMEREKESPESVSVLKAFCGTVIIAGEIVEEDGKELDEIRHFIERVIAVGCPVGNATTFDKTCVEVRFEKKI